MELKLLDLFSGIGGFSLGLESTGYFKTIAFVEKDKFCHEVLKKNFPNIPIESEVRNVKGNKYKADVITGGFPCQPFSVAGKRKGTDDDRYLWDETIRIIRETKPRWFIGENVEGIINIQEGMVLRQVCDDLEEEGFEVQCLVIPASSIGAWHQRKRIWIVAYSDSNRHSNKIRGSSTKEERISQEHRQEHNTSRKSSGASSVWETNNQYVPNSNSRLSKRKTEQIQARGNATTFSSKDVPNSDSFRYGRWGSKGCTNGEWSFLPREQKGGEMGSEAERCNDITSNTSSEGSQGHGVSTDMETKQRSEEFTTETSVAEQQTWWQTQSELCGVPNGVSYELDKDRKNRIKSLGNSIVPLIARELGLAIIKAEQE